MLVGRSLAAALVILALALLALGRGAAAATAGKVTGLERPGCYVPGMTAAAGGGVWVWLCGKGRQSGTTLAQIDPTGAIVRRAVPGSKAGPIAGGLEGEVWIADTAPEADEAPALRRLDPDGRLDAFAFRGSLRPLAIYDIAVGAEGAAWVAAGEPMFAGPGPASATGKLLRVGADGTQAEFPLPKEVEPRGIALGPDGNLWFTGVKGSYSIEHTSSWGVGYVGRMTPTGTVTLFPTRTKESGPETIVAGPAGRLWFYENGIHQIGTIGTDGTFGRAYKLPRQSWHSDLTFGPEGDLWIGGGEAGLLRLTPRGRLTRFGGATASVVTGAEGGIWSLSAGTLRRFGPARGR